VAEPRALIEVPSAAPSAVPGRRPERRDKGNGQRHHIPAWLGGIIRQRMIKQGQDTGMVPTSHQEIDLVPES
jgi:hypothetical protein